MMLSFKPVLLGTDLALLALFAGGVIALWRWQAQPPSRATVARLLQDPAAVCAGALLLVFLAITALDSVHFRRALPAAPGEALHYDARTESLLDLLLARPLAMRETSYSRPLAWRGLTKEAVIAADGTPGRDFPRLTAAGAHLRDPAREAAGDLLWRGGAGAGIGLLLWIGLAVALRPAVRRHRHGPLEPLLLLLGVLFALTGATIALAGHYHVFGTDRTGNDVLVQALKSVRTAFVIGALSTLATVPLAVGLGLMAGYYRGWVDAAIQYLYTVLNSVPNVLLIAACVLMVQVFLDQHPELFETGLERADLKVLLLCGVLGITGWSTLCRLVRAETLKLRELDHVQAATAFGIGDARILLRHILPGVMHLVLVTTVLQFSDLVLYEAVLTYVGVGVDPSTSSFGGMINLARGEMSRDPLVWWSFAAAFVFMVALVLAANLFADGVREAFDPRAVGFRARRLRRTHAGA